MNTVWISPDIEPVVEAGEEEIFWIAVHSQYTGKTHVYPAQFQNRPLELDENDDPAQDWVLYNDDGYVGSVGWVTCKEHYEYSDWYEPIEFTEKYKLLGWAEFRPPEFDGIAD